MLLVLFNAGVALIKPSASRASLPGSRVGETRVALVGETPGETLRGRDRELWSCTRSGIFGADDGARAARVPERFDLGERVSGLALNAIAS